LRTAWSGDAVLVAGNTVEGEEELVLEAWRHARQTHATLRLILAPRHPRRFQEAATLLAAGKVRFLRASEPWPDQEETWREVDVLLLDTLGELPAAYGEGTVAMVGGGWCWHGGHNPLEPVRWGLPTLLGPGYANFEDLVAPLLEAKALNVVAPEGLSAAVLHALDRAPLRPNASGRELPEMLRGALERTWREIQDFLPVTR
jgi:3-deoxy-D-manno-octulosonic-acid transferase